MYLVQIYKKEYDRDGNEIGGLAWRIASSHTLLIDAEEQKIRYSQPENMIRIIEE